jgi:hypothetical protein
MIGDDVTLIALALLIDVKPTMNASNTAIIPIKIDTLKILFVIILILRNNTSNNAEYNSVIPRVINEKLLNTLSMLLTS